MKNYTFILILILPIALMGEVIDSGCRICTIYHATQMNVRENGGDWGTYQKCDIQLVVADMGFGEGVVTPPAPKPTQAEDGSNQTFYYNVQYFGITYNDTKTIKTKFGIGKGGAGIEEVIKLILYKNGESYFYANISEKNYEVIYMIDSVASYQVTRDINIVYKGDEKPKRKHK